MYTLDTSAIIYFLTNKDLAVKTIEKIFAESLFVYVPTVVRAELLSKSALSLDEENAIKSFLKNTTKIILDDHIADMSAYIRREYKLKLPDAIIAATAIAMGSVLVTGNESDFKKVKELKIIKV
ncbi:MAG: hypothetical protein UU24_C0041G0002 [Candidatus Nomurabacteria bacterium GW2011_GWA2_40_9]|uniref:PIN domain-containing protein n=1 Tax=Candidatus Nomurabacteria bacterium GW2011_GWA2_40_9 TaxID=1618734 RepID=A0A0G0TTJ5_9BACT|nr:MAG: hypothetical protein UU24_C0041G0002 [Candidatus Nomurabacteria bacterium GW2011_GWA2_40_9]